MKTFAQVLLVIIVIVVVWVLYTNRQAAQREAERRELQRIEQERQREEAARQLPIPTPAEQTAPTPAPKVIINRPVVSKKAEVFEAARAARVTITRYTEQANGSIIDCWAEDRNYLGDFLDELMNRGIMKDLDLNKRTYRVTRDRQGREQHWAHYEIRW
jgi:hypothetical protein